MKIKLFLTAFALLVLNSGFSQNKKESNSISKTSVFSESLNNAKVFAPNGVIRCASVEYQNSKKANGRVASDQAFEEWLAPKIQEIKRLRQLGRLPSVITIPVVVHVIHNGDAVGTGENIADGQVLSQITVFNQDFRKMTGTPGNGAGVDTMIQFCMAQVDPNGNPTNGIDRRQFTTASYNGAAVEARKASTIWDPTKYLNMWTFRFTGDLNGVLGYAQFPTGSGLEGMPTEDCITGEASTDGVVAAFDTFGSRTLFPTGTYNGTSYDKGRTMTHEVGHMLGLRHIWGDGGCGVDDFCTDTPESDDANYGCPTTHVSCGTLDMVRNYMDYTDDSCMNIFTQDQADRMIACLMNSPRRDDLLVSTVCTPVSQPYIQFKRQVCESRAVESILEGNGCSYTEFTVPLNIDKAPSANAVVTFAIDGASVANAGDIQIMTPTVTFNAGSTADRNLVFRVLNDGYVEIDEQLMITFTVNNGGGDAVENPEGKVFSMTILNDDTAVSPIQTQQIFYEGFETYTDFTVGNVGGWTTYDLDGDATYPDDTYDFPNEEYTGSYIVFNPSATTPSAVGGGYDAHSGNKGYYCYNESVAPFANNDWAITPQISLGTNSQLKFWAKSLTDNYNGGERFKVLVSTTNTSTISFTSISANPYVIPPLTWTEYTYDLSAYNNQNIYIAIQCVSSDEFVFMLDDVSVTSDVSIAIQTSVDTGTPGQTALNGSGTAGYKDSSSNNIITSVVVNDANNYGCTTASVSRAGTSGVQYGASTNVANFAMSKQFTITPANVLNGSSTITFYFTEAEVAGWETFTGNARSQLFVAKDGVTQEVQSLTIGAFGSDVTMTATFTTGVDGVYSFATQASLPAESFNLTGLTLYPNPNNGIFNIQFVSTTNEVNINVYDLRGRQIFNKTFSSNGIFNELLNLSSVDSGVYLVTIQDGSRNITKKILIE